MTAPSLGRSIPEPREAAPVARGAAFLRLCFVVGAVADLAVAGNWLAISAGRAAPNLISGYLGTGADYRFAMYIATMFMIGWTVLLCWGALRPVERRGLLPITAALLAASVAVELLAFPDMARGAHFVAGLIARVLLVGKFTSAYVYSLLPPRR